MNKRRFLPVLFVLLIGLAALVIVLIIHSDSHLPLDVPIYIGGAPSAPGAVDNQHARMLTSWSSSDLKVSSSGRLTGHITAKNTASDIVDEPHRDVLVVQIYAVFAPRQITRDPNGLAPFEGYDSPITRALNERVPILAQHTSPASASFQVDAPFRLPQSQENSGPLKYLKVDLLWARFTIQNWLTATVPAYPAPSPAATRTLDPTQFAFFSTAYPALLSPELYATWTPPPGGYATAVPVYMFTLMESGGLVSYTPPILRFNQVNTSLNGIFIYPASDSYAMLGIDLNQWLYQWSKTHINLP